MDSLALFVDTTTPDTVKPQISFSITQGYIYAVDSPIISVTVTDAGTVDSVYIKGIKATYGSNQWAAKVGLIPDSNKVEVKAWNIS